MIALPRRIAALALVASALFAQPALAQQPTQSEMAVARRLFRTGLEAARAGRWEDARNDFERSYRVAAVPTTLLNLAGAQVETGQLVAGMESYQRFLSRATSGRAVSYREQAEEALEAVQRRVPRVTIHAPSIEDGDQLRIDGESISTAVLDTELPLDPGAHQIVLVRDGAEVAREDVSLDEGEEETVRLEARAAPSLDVTEGGFEDDDDANLLVSDQEAGEDDEGGGVLSSPWLWLGVGAVVVGGVLAAILIATAGGGNGGDLYSGNVDPGHLTY